MPFQPNANADGTANPRRAGTTRSSSAPRKPDPGGLPLGTLEYLSFSRFFNTPGTPFQATLNLKLGRGHARAPAPSR